LGFFEKKCTKVKENQKIEIANILVNQSFLGIQTQ